MPSSSRVGEGAPFSSTYISIVKWISIVTRSEGTTLSQSSIWSRTMNIFSFPPPTQLLLSPQPPSKASAAPLSTLPSIILSSPIPIPLSFYSFQTPPPSNSKAPTGSPSSPSSKGSTPPLPRAKISSQNSSLSASLAYATLLSLHSLVALRAGRRAHSSLLQCLPNQAGERHLLEMEPSGVPFLHQIATYSSRELGSVEALLRVICSHLQKEPSAFIFLEPVDHTVRFHVSP